MTSFLVQLPVEQNLGAMLDHVVRTAESFLATAGNVQQTGGGTFARTGRGRELEVVRVVSLKVEAELSRDDQLARASSLERVLKTMCASTDIPADKVRVFVQQAAARRDKSEKVTKEP